MGTIYRNFQDSFYYNGRIQESKANDAMWATIIFECEYYREISEKSLKYLQVMAFKFRWRYSVVVKRKENKRVWLILKW